MHSIFMIEDILERDMFDSISLYPQKGAVSNGSELGGEAEAEAIAS